MGYCYNRFEAMFGQVKLMMRCVQCVHRSSSRIQWMALMVDRWHLLGLQLEEPFVALLALQIGVNSQRWETW